MTLIDGTTPLNPDLLYLFLLGPGEGECVIIRVPPDHWVVIDSFEIAERPSAEALLDAYDARVDLVVLTHPHRDHCRGVIDLLDSFAPRTIGCVHPRRDDYLHGVTADPVEQLQECSRPTYRRIWDDWNDKKAAKWQTFRDEKLSVGDLELRSLHPENDIPESRWNAKYANDLSSAMQLTWHDLRIVLGADVTNKSWGQIANRESSLAEHHLMKVPHHVSTEAIHPCFGDGDEDRLWLATPFSRGRGLPPRRVNGGIDLALQFVKEIHLTSLPYSHDHDDDEPCLTTRQQLELNSLPTKTGTPSDDPDVQSQRMVAVSYRSNGERVDLEYGPGTIKIARDP